MGRKRTVLIVMLSILLAALIAAAGVLGVAMARSAFSDTDEAYVSEARWSVEFGEATEAVNVDVTQFRPDYREYDGDAEKFSGRSNLCDGCVAVLKNCGDVTARVTITAVSDPVYCFDTDTCSSPVDHNRYSEEEIAEHIRCYGIFLATEDGYVSGSDPDQTLVEVELGPGESAYVLSRVNWVTDLEKYAVFVEDAGGKEVCVYDGTDGDEFDTWAGEHLLGFGCDVTMKCEQVS